MSDQETEIVIEVEVPAADSAADNGPAETVIPVTIDLVERVTRLEGRLDVCEGRVSAVEGQASMAQVSADIAQDSADMAMSVAVEADVTADAVADAVTEIAETTETEVDDQIVAEVIPDEPARKGNLWFDDNVRERIRL